MLDYRNPHGGGGHGALGFMAAAVARTIDRLGALLGGLLNGRRPGR